MTPTQKRFVEWPLILLLVWSTQVLEISSLRVPLLGPVQILPVLITYLAVTRAWGELFWQAATFAFLGSSVIGYPWPVYLAVQVWTALILHLVVQTFALEGRQAFTGLSALGSVTSKVLTYLVLRSGMQVLPFNIFLRDLFGAALSASILAWFLFPLFAAWDAYFEHEADEARELKPGALR